MNAREYVETVLTDWKVDSLLVVISEQGRFWVKHPEPGHYFIEVPERHFADPGLAARYELRHECGHVILDELFEKRATVLASILDGIEQMRPVLCWMQRVWYWNPTLRRIRGWFGFAPTLDYGPEDIYRESAFTRADVELFADWYAWSGHRKLEESD